VLRHHNRLMIRNARKLPMQQPFNNSLARLWLDEATGFFSEAFPPMNYATSLCRMVMCMFSIMMYRPAVGHFDWEAANFRRVDLR